MQLSGMLILQWAGCLAGLVALLLLLRTAHWGYGLILVLASNGLWMTFGAATQTLGVIVQPAVLALTGLVGIWRCLIEPRLVAAGEKRVEEWSAGHFW